MFRAINLNPYIIKIRTAISLGLVNIFYVLLYRLSLKLKKNNMPKVNMGSSFFNAPKSIESLKTTENWLDEAICFGYHKFNLNKETPNWHQNPFNKVVSDKNNYAWWKIPDFDSSLGDIKTVWEASRFDWLLSFAQQAKVGNSNFVDKLNFWIKDWVNNNPPYYGINWKCGQESSIRVLHLAMSSVILNQYKNTNKDLLNLINLHLDRIAPTIHYAVAQNNNHGTSEAAALYIGGSWLMSNGYNVKKARDWYKLGKKWLHNRASKLIEKDGSFSQYSVNYHRVMLDTFSMVEVWRTHLNLEPLSKKWYDKSKQATNWLRSMIDETSGSAPIIGANDGARLLPLTDTDYLDYRPSVQLAAALFFNEKAYINNQSCDLPLKWLGIQIPETKMQSFDKVQQYDDGGYFVLRDSKALVTLRYPRFSFRPSQSDLLHIDFWVNGSNVLRDAGTFSYNADQKMMDYFPSTQAHNTIEFDKRDQMPKLSRFLYGAWLKTNKIKKPILSEGTYRFGAGYRDIYGACHFRELIFGDYRMKIIDTISGFKDSAIIRYRLNPGWSWNKTVNSVVCPEMEIKIHTDLKFKRFELIDGLESRYYLHKTSLPVLEIELDQSGCIETEIVWS